MSAEFLTPASACAYRLPGHLGHRAPRPATWRAANARLGSASTTSCSVGRLRIRCRWTRLCAPGRCCRRTTLHASAFAGAVIRAADCAFVDGRNAEARGQAWAADIHRFRQHQETYGLAPNSDGRGPAECGHRLNGYRDTIRDGSTDQGADHHASPRAGRRDPPPSRAAA